MQVGAISIADNQMSKNKKPRRRYVKGSGFSAISASLPFSEEAKTSLKSKAYLAWAAFKSGTATTDDFDLLAATANVCMIQAEIIHESCVDICKDATDAIMAIRERHDRLGRFGVDAEALRVIPELLELYSELLDNSTPRMMTDSVEAAFKRLNRQIFYKGQ